jgi:hypothetical protein
MTRMLRTGRSARYLIIPVIRESKKSWFRNFLCPLSKGIEFNRFLMYNSYGFDKELDFLVGEL